MHLNPRFHSVSALGLLAAGLLCISTVAQGQGLINPDFSVAERSVVLASEGGAAQCDTDLEAMCDGQLTSLPGWTLIDLGEQFIVTDTSGLDGLDGAGGTVVRFSEQDDALTGDDDGIAQCVSLADFSPGDEFAYAARVATQFPRLADGGELPVELALKFYADADCGDELDEGFDLDDDLVELAGEDFVFFQRFDLVGNDTVSVASGVEAVVIAPWTFETVSVSGEVPAGFDGSVAVFIGAGDQTDGGGQPTGPRQTYLDAVSLSVSGSDNLLINGDFDQFPDDASAAEFFAGRTPFPDDDQGPFGWMITDLDEDGGAAVQPLPAPGRGFDFEAVSGDRVFKFRAVDSEGDGPAYSDLDDDNIDQCMFVGDIESDGNALSAWFRTNRSDRISVVMSWEFFDDYDTCLVAPEDDPLASGRIFALNAADEWVPFVAGIGDPGSAQWMRISLRVADRLGNDPGTWIMLDDVRFETDVDVPREAIPVPVNGALGLMILMLSMLMLGLWGLLRRTA